MTHTQITFVFESETTLDEKQCLALMTGMTRAILPRSVEWRGEPPAEIPPCRLLRAVAYDGHGDLLPVLLPADAIIPR